jgi:hypothetical protein
MDTGWSLRNWRASRKRRVGPPAGIDSPLIFQDGFGTRWTALDAESGEPVEVLSFAPELVEVPDFAGAVGERVARLARVRHTLYARARRLDRPSEDSLLLFSDRVPGWRLSDVLDCVEKEKIGFDIGAILAMLRQLIPAVALFSRHQRDATIGTVGPERLILTPQGRLVVAEYVLAPGIEKLQYSRERLWRDLRVVLPPAASPSRLPPSADVVGVGVVALSLLHGRLLKEDEYLFSLGDLVDAATESVGDERRPLSAGLSGWLGRALQFDDRTALQSPQEVQVAFEEMLAKERGYVTTASQLDLFVSRIERTIGPPVAMPSPPPVPVSQGPTLVSIAPVAAPGPEPSPEPKPARPAVVAAAATVAEAPPPAAAPTTPRPVVTPRPAAASPRPEPEAPPQWWRPLLAPVPAAVVAVAVLEAAAIGWLVFGRTGGASGRQGEVVVQSRPAAARVAIDGEDRGVTPLTVALNPGAHVVEVRVGRSEPRVIPVDVKDGVQHSLYVELQSVATVGGLDVRTDPAYAKVTVDGRPRGTTPLVLRDLAPGDHEVLLEAGRQRVRQTVRIEPGMTSQLVVPMGGR